MNKKAQLAVPIITMAIIIIGLIFIAPMILKMVNAVVTPFQSVIGNQSSFAGESVGVVQNTFVNMWDWVIFIAIILNIMLFLVSAFLIDTHPAFIFVFILAGFFMVLFAPTIVEDAVGRMWDMSAFDTERTQLPVTEFVKDYFGAIMVGIMVLGGVILYARVKAGGRIV